MSKRKRPRAFRGPADHYASPGERIVEITFSDGTGGLISIRDKGDGPANRIDIYRLDAGTQVAACGELLTETKQR